MPMAWNFFNKVKEALKFEQAEIRLENEALIFCNKAKEAFYDLRKAYALYLGPLEGSQSDYMIMALDKRIDHHRIMGRINEIRYCLKKILMKDFSALKEGQRAQSGLSGLKEANRPMRFGQASRFNAITHADEGKMLSEAKYLLTVLEALNSVEITRASKKFARPELVINAIHNDLSSLESGLGELSELIFAIVGYEREAQQATKLAFAH